MKENDYFICLMCHKVLNNARERKQHLRMHRERNETCATLGTATGRRLSTTREDIYRMCVEGKTPH